MQASVAFTKFVTTPPVSPTTTPPGSQATITTPSSSQATVNSKVPAGGSRIPSDASKLCADAVKLPEESPKVPDPVAAQHVDKKRKGKGRKDSAGDQGADGVLMDTSG